MVDIRPFRALRPPADIAKHVASPPYDVLSSAEARTLAEGKPNSFLHVIKPEIDLDPEIGLYDDRVYAKAAANLAHMVNTGAMVRDESPHFYVYRQQMGDHVQTGLVAGASVAEYESGTIKKHEKTRPNKEDDRTRHIMTLKAQTGPVFLTHRRDEKIAGILENVSQTEPTYDFIADDDIRHTLWVVDQELNDSIAVAFGSLDALYIADGHHRSAAASRVAEAHRQKNPNHSGEEGYNFFLSVVFPDDEMKILDYNRVVFDLNGHSKDDFLAKVRQKFDVVTSSQAKPNRARTFRMYLDGQWYELEAKSGTYPEDHPVDSLDVSILQSNLLAPVLGIEDPRTSERVDFVGGIRGPEELKRRVDEGAAVAFALYPTSMDELMAIADADEIMPPKSTWFEPKLRSGLVVRPLDD